MLQNDAKLCKMTQNDAKWPVINDKMVKNDKTTKVAINNDKMVKNDETTKGIIQIMTKRQQCQWNLSNYYDSETKWSRRQKCTMKIMKIWN